MSPGSAHAPQVPARSRRGEVHEDVLQHSLGVPQLMSGSVQMGGLQMPVQEMLHDAA